LVWFDEFFFEHITKGSPKNQGSGERSNHDFKLVVAFASTTSLPKNPETGAVWSGYLSRYFNRFVVKCQVLGEVEAGNAGERPAQ